MRTIDELGISPTPWERTHNHPRIVWNGRNLPLVTGINPADASLIAAAPELYESVVKLLCVIEKYRNNWNRISMTLEECELAIETAKSVLSKASGEEVK